MCTLLLLFICLLTFPYPTTLLPRYRPLAPAVLAEHLSDWFTDLTHVNPSLNPNGCTPSPSPYMSITAQIHPNKVTQIPAVTHIDNSARLQTINKYDNYLFYMLINAFYKLTGVPMVLNTSFNGNKEPVVESPADAIQVDIHIYNMMLFIILYISRV